MLRNIAEGSGYHLLCGGSLKSLKFHSNLTRMKGSIHEDTYTFMIICHLILPRMRNVSHKSCRENQNTHSMFSNFFPPENCAVCEIMWKNVVEPDRSQMTIWRMRFASCITKVTDTHSEYVILIALPRQQ